MGKRKAIIREFSSMAEWVTHCGGETDYAGYRASRDSEASVSGNGSRFYHSADYAEAETLAFSWAEGAKRIEKMRSKIAIKGQAPRNIAALAEQGPGVISMASYVQGHPQPWVVLRKGQQMRRGQAKVVKILVNSTFSAGIKGTVVERRGAAILALADSLERAGRRVEITLAMPNGGGGATEGVEYRVIVKRASERLNLQSLAFAVAHPSMLRRLTFSAMEREQKADRDALGVGGGYGSVVECFEVTEDENSIYFPGLKYGDNRWESEESAATFVREEAARRGVVLG